MAKIGKMTQIGDPNVYSPADAAIDLADVFAQLYSKGQTAKINEEASRAASTRHVQANIIADLSDTSQVLETSALENQISILDGMAEAETTDESMRDLAKVVADRLRNNALVMFKKRDEIGLNYQETQDALKSIHLNFPQQETDRETLENARDLINDLDESYFNNAKYLDGQQRQAMKEDLRSWTNESLAIDYLLMGDDPTTVDEFEKAVPKGWDNTKGAAGMWAKAWQHYEVGDIPEVLESIRQLAEQNESYWKHEEKQKIAEKQQFDRDATQDMRGRMASLDTMTTDDTRDPDNQRFWKEDFGGAGSDFVELIENTNPTMDFTPTSGIITGKSLSTSLDTRSDFIRGAIKDEFGKGEKSGAFDDLWGIINKDRINIEGGGSSIDNNLGDTDELRNHKFTALLALVSSGELSDSNWDEFGRRGTHSAGKYVKDHVLLYLDSYEMLYGEVAREELDKLYMKLKDSSYSPAGQSRDDWLETGLIKELSEERKGTRRDDKDDTAISGVLGNLGI